METSRCVQNDSEMHETVLLDCMTGESQEYYEVTPDKGNSVISCTPSRFHYTVEPLWKRKECLTKVAKFGPFPCTILYKSCLFYPSWQATSFERPPWVTFKYRGVSMYILTKFGVLTFITHILSTHEIEMALALWISWYFVTYFHLFYWLHCIHESK